MKQHKAVRRTEGIGYAEEGETIRTKVDDAFIDWTVGPACSDVRGYWLCATHDETFQRNIERDAHVDDGGNHNLVWMCLTHGAEVP